MGISYDLWHVVCPMACPTACPASYGLFCGLSCVLRPALWPGPNLLGRGAMAMGPAQLAQMEPEFKLDDHQMSDGGDGVGQGDHQMGFCNNNSKPVTDRIKS